MPRSFDRRGFLTAAGGGAFGLAVGTGAAAAAGNASAAIAQSVPFHGEHQAGIATAAQDRLFFATFDLTIETKSELRDLLRDWTAAAAAMTAGWPVGAAGGRLDAPPLDTGEAVGLPPARLTMTFGLGETVFSQGGKDRFGLAARKPAALSPLGALPGDGLEAARSGGDLCVQACADDPTVAFHAVRNLARIARGAAVLRWSQLGFGRTSSTQSTQSTARNLQGFKDGTNNLHGNDEAAMNRSVWVGDEEPAVWFRGGSYLVSRRIRMLIETWDRSSLGDQEATIGRFKASGAPLTGRHEHDVPDLAAKRKDGLGVIAADAHIRLAAPATNGGLHILRRGYSYTDGIDPVTGELDAGLFFLAFQRDPHRQFAAIQRRLGEHDALGEYIVHTGSGLFAVPPGIRPGGFLAQGLF
ncbi:MAG TPA: iron uptake transporter deferrochelatase/peroxidase subunit [Gaiellaceae bacterium]|nr:iron uptake transporter deferrochelatase/peroxidase subunit [Gaiellaceae bacterium]